MKAKKIVYLHIGTHKTGSTSIQHYMLDNRERHQSEGLDFYLGLHLECNHVELHMASMQKERLSPFIASSLKAFDPSDPAYRSLIHNRIKDYIKETKSEKVVFSTEGLSYLRYDDELSFLKRCFDDSEVFIILYLRNKKSFLNSYCEQLIKSGFSFSEDPMSFAYVKEDSWLLDYDNLIKIYGEYFGWDHLILLSYDNALKNDKNIIPSFLNVIGMNRLSPANLEDYWKNIT